MAVDMATVKELREKTGYGIMAVKKALEETGGDVTEAEVLLRKKADTKAGGKTERATGEGVIAIRRLDDAVIMAEVGCEQEPTTNNDRFQAFVAQTLDLAAESGATDVDTLLACKTAEGTLADTAKSLVGVLSENIQVKRIVRLEAEGGVLGSYEHFNKKSGAICRLEVDGADASQLQTIANDVCMHAAAMKPPYLTREDVPADIIEKEKDIFRDEVKDKPENIQDKILMGKLGKFFSDVCLVDQAFVKSEDGKTSVAKCVTAAAKAAGGKASVTAYARFMLGQ
jgi:elongation factor Ts